MGIIIIIIITIIFIFYLFLFILDKKISKLEKIINTNFTKRTDIIPAIFEISKGYLNKHHTIYKEILRLRKIEFSLNSRDKIKMYKIIKIETLIHHEIEFIFKICDKHKKIFKNGNFLYLKDLIIEDSFKIGEKLKLYKNIIKKFNNMIKIKNLTIIGLFFHIEERIEL